MKKLLLLLPALALTFSMCSKSDDPIEEDLPEPITDTLPTVDTLPVVDTPMCVIFSNRGSEYVDLYIDGERMERISKYGVYGFEYSIKLESGIHTFQLYRWKHYWPVEEFVVTKDTTILLQYDDTGIENVLFISNENSNVQVYDNYSYLGTLSDGSLFYGTGYDFSYMAMRESDGAIVRGNVILNDSLTVVPVDFETSEDLFVPKRIWMNSHNYANIVTGEMFFSGHIYMSNGEIEKDGLVWEKVYQNVDMDFYGYLRMSDNKMYWTKDFSEIKVICDWNLEKGDTTVYNYYYGSFGSQTEFVDTVVNYVFQDGITRKCILELKVDYYVDPRWEMLVVDGIGSLDGFMECYQGIADAGGKLNFYYENGKLVYSINDYWKIGELFDWAYSCK